MPTLQPPVLPTENDLNDTLIDVISYDREQVVEKSGVALHQLKDYLQDERITWVNVKHLSDADKIREVCNIIGIDYLITSDILNLEHTTKIEDWGDFLITICKVLRFENNDDDENLIAHKHLSIVLKDNSVITFCEKHDYDFEHLKESIRNNSLGIRQKQANYLYTKILDRISRNYSAVIDELDDRINLLEDELLDISQQRESENYNQEIQLIRKSYISFKKACLPLREQIQKVIRTEHHPLLTDENKMYIYDINDHIQYAYQEMEVCKDTISSLVDLYLANNDLQMNKIMKRLTIVSTIFIPLTFLAGIWGMNFEHMPELHWKYGYYIAWGIMVLVAIVVYIFLKKKKWTN